MLAKMAGLPYLVANEGNASGLPEFLPNAIMLSDILHSAGYRQVAISGSEGSFASIDTFWNTHGGVQFDLEYYKKNGFIPADYYENWGFEDIKVYEFAKMQIAELTKNDAPFMLFIETMDTHPPYGYVCDLCPPRQNKNDYEQIFQVVQCADQQVYDFLEWAKTQSWYEDTVFIIVGDHTYQDPKNADLFNNKADRRWFNLIINSEVEPSENADVNRKFCSFDWFPTTLESLGFKVEGHSLGFGRSLFTGEKTLYEKYAEDVLHEELTKKTVQYESLK